jgi:septum formation protein
MRLILASTSPYRRDLLARLGLGFECIAPEVDEQALPGESPLQLCRRLSEAKARAVASRHPDALVIGSDQVAERAGLIVGKPLERSASLRQLASASGHSMLFHTGLCLLHQASGRRELHVEPTLVRFRRLSDAMIEHYLGHEDALDCAGGFKCEALGIALFDSISSDDPTALVGLPLIALRRALAAFGLDPLQPR